MSNNKIKMRVEYTENSNDKISTMNEILSGVIYNGGDLGELMIVNGNKDVIIFISKEGAVYLRSGQCNMCGKCCVAFSVDNLGENGMCCFLDQITKKCSLERKGIKPIQCKLSPRSPSESVDENCGYYWKKIGVL